MSTTDLPDIELLLAPISPDQPSGIDLRENRTDEFNDIRDARRAASKAEREAAIDPEHQYEALNFWKQIAELAPLILEKQSKDLEVACWLTEAQIRLNGVTGLYFGVQLLSKLIDSFWQEIYPIPDEDGLETRVKPLLGVFGGESEGTLISAIRNLPIMPEGFGKDAVDTFSWWNYDLALKASKIEIAEKKAAKVASLGYSIEDIEKEIARVPLTFVELTLEEGQKACDELSTLSNTLIELAKKSLEMPTPSISKIKELLQDTYLASIRHIYKSKLESNEEAVEKENAESGKTVSADSNVEAINTNSTKLSGERTMSRQQALQQLSSIANYFRETEPHTPIAGAIDRVVRWGNMPFDSLMRELLPQEQARATFAQLTGVELGNDQSNYSSTSISPIDVSNSDVRQQSVESSQSSGEQW